MYNTNLRYVVIRYMFNDLADEAANVGIVALTDDPPRIICRFLDDPAVKSRNDAKIRKEFLLRFANHIETLKREFETGSTALGPLSSTTIIEQIREYSSGILQTNMPRLVLTNDAEQEVNLLFNQWVAPRGAVARRLTTSRDPLGGLRREASVALVKLFRQGYGAPLSQKNFRRRYEIKGLSHKSVIDLAMIDRTGGTRREHLFHHVLLLASAEESFNQAAGLSCRWVDITARNHVDRDLTAILYKREGQLAKGVEDATDLLKESNIGVTNLSDVPKLAQKLKSQGELPL